VAESRSYRLDAGEALPDGIARIARGRIDHAIEELSGGTRSTPEEAVHEARKDMKKLRALLRLVRGELGGDWYARENACFRDAARELAGVRDADVMLETLEALDVPAPVASDLRNRIQAEEAPRRGDGRAIAARGVVEVLVEARRRVDEWPLRRDSFAAVADGLERTYRRGRRDFKAARREPTVEGLHEWRKRVKELWYHHTVLRCLWPPVMAAVGDEAHELAGRLGDDRDLALLADWVRDNVGEEPALSAAVDRRRKELQREALALGERLYADKPSAYMRRLKRLWNAGADLVRAP
jgi:CHAD domain-containing protein